MAKEIIKTADASIAAKVRDPNLLIVRALQPTHTAFLPTGDVVEFVNDQATITREQAAHFQDTNRFAFDVQMGATPEYPHSDLPDPTRAAATEDPKE